MKFHYVSRLSDHFQKKLAKSQELLTQKSDKVKGKAELDEKCNLIKHYTRRLKTRTCRELVTANYECTCDKVIREKTMCSIYDGCYAAAKTAMLTAKAEIVKKNAAAKLEWRAVYRIKCLMKVLKPGQNVDANERQLNNCIQNTISTSALNLNLYSVPAKQACSLDGVNSAM